MHRLVIIGSLDENIELVREARSRGYYTIVCDGYPNGPAKAFANKAYNLDVRDCGRIARMCQDEKADGIVGSFSDLIFECITKIAAETGLQWYVRPEMLKYYREKSVAKGLMAEIGIPVPNYRHLDQNFIDSDIDGLQYPLVVKPNSGWGSKGVRVVENLAQLREYFERERPKGAGYIVEEYMDGKEHNAICWVVDGKVKVICIGDRNKNPRTGQGVPVLNRVVYPSTQQSELSCHVQSVLQRFIDATGQRSGPLSIQFFSDRNGMKVCEIAGRVLGHEHPMISRYSGISIPGLLLDMIYDAPKVTLELEKYTPRPFAPCAGLYFLCEDGQVVHDMTIADEFSRNPSVFKSVLYYNNGDTVDNLGWRSYFAKYFISEKNRSVLDTTTMEFFSNWHIFSPKGKDIAYPFILET